MFWWRWSRNLFWWEALHPFRKTRWYQPILSSFFVFTWCTSRHSCRCIHILVPINYPSLFRQFENHTNAGGEIHFNSRLTDIQINQQEITAWITNSRNKKKKSWVAKVWFCNRSLCQRYLLNCQTRETSVSKPNHLLLGCVCRTSSVYHWSGTISYLCSKWTPSSCQLLTTRQVKNVECIHLYVSRWNYRSGSNRIWMRWWNGWSPSKRNNPFANSGMVVSVGEKDFLPYKSLA